MTKSWMMIGIVTFSVARIANFIRSEDFQWFKRLQRPSWLTFENVIPLIWIIVFICGAWSAYIAWENTKDWLLMGFYLLVELVTVSCHPAMLRLRSLKIGTIFGGTGAILGILLASTVLPISGLAMVLLLPYVIWRSIGTYATWETIRLNPADT